MDRSIFDAQKELRAAEIGAVAAQRPKEVQRIRLFLDEKTTEASAYFYSGAFRSLLVERVSDGSAEVYFKPNQNTSDQSFMTLKQRDSWKISTPVSSGYFFWNAQPGKWVDIVIFYDSEFSSGSYAQVSSGGVAITEGDSAQTPVSITLAATTVTQILPANSARVTATLQNKTGSDLFIGGSTTLSNTGASEGIIVSNGAVVKWRNKGALYGYSVAGGKITYLEEV